MRAIVGQVFLIGFIHVVCLLGFSCLTGHNPGRMRDGHQLMYDFATRQINFNSIQFYFCWSCDMRPCSRKHRCVWVN